MSNLVKKICDQWGSWNSSCSILFRLVHHQKNDVSTPSFD